MTFVWSRAHGIGLAQSTRAWSAFRWALAVVSESAQR
jgi:hypothetical protein